MRLPFLLLPVLLVAGLGLAGCSSVADPTASRGEMDGALPVRTQQRLLRGTVLVGDTPDMVRLALGEPDQRADAPDAAGPGSVWIYKKYYQQIEHREATGWSRVIVPEVRNQNDVVVQPSVTQELYRAEVDDYLRVAFVGGVVSSVAQLKP